MVATKKPTAVKTVKPKAPPKPKPFEVGYEFNIKAKIIEVHPENDEYNYPFKVEVGLGDFEDMDDNGGGSRILSYVSKQDLLNLVSKAVPALSKSMKQEELNKAKAEVVRLTKELAAIK
jgi:hypothetical protein